MSVNAPAESAAHALEIRDLSKTYGNGVRALQGISLTIAPGMFGLLGPNGAGKSTLMRTLATLQDPDGGSIRMGELDFLHNREGVRRVLGYLPQEFGLYPRVTAVRLLEHLAVLKGITGRKDRRQLVDALLHQTNLTEARNRALGTFSGGMKQRFGIAQALIGNPRVIIVDEPTAGLDPEERIRFHNLLSEIGQERIVILSTHIVDDVAELCSRMAVINGGQLLLSGEPRAAMRALRGMVWTKVIHKNEVEAHRAAHRVLATRMFAGELMIRVLSAESPGQGFEAADPQLEDVYFAAIKHGHRGGAAASKPVQAMAEAQV